MPITLEEEAGEVAVHRADGNGTRRADSSYPIQQGVVGSGPHGPDGHPEVDAFSFPTDSGDDADDIDNFDENDENDDDDDDPEPPPPLSPHAFAPPFYGRPPTPLPPSPSLTSLLRPSRPTTPDASEDDNKPHHPHHHQHSSHHHHHHHHHPGDPVPRARPKVPTYEYYGFVLYLFSSLSFLIYLLWSYLPSPFLHALGIYYYPNRWWSLAIPSWLVMLLGYMYVALAGYNLEVLTLPLESVETVVDEAAQVAVVDARGRIAKRDGKRDRDRDRDRDWSRDGNTVRGRGRAGSEAGVRGRDGVADGGRKGRGWGRETGGGRAKLDWREVWNEGTDAVMDVPLAGVCEVLYGEGREWDSELEDEDVVITRV